MAKSDTAPAQSGGVKHLLLASIGVSVLGLGAGFLMAAALLTADQIAVPQNHDSKTVKAESESGREEASASEVEKPPADFEIVPIKPIVTNLLEPSSVWVRLEGNLLMHKEGELKPDILAVKLSQHILAYLRTLKITDVQGVGALHAISQDLNEIVTTVSKGQAQGVLISGLVFE
jgi:flagellar protein FliL